MSYLTKESAFLTLVMGNMHGLNSDTDISLKKKSQYLIESGVESRRLEQNTNNII